jgi:hypothetical protein
MLQATPAQGLQSKAPKQEAQQQQTKGVQGKQQSRQHQTLWLEMLQQQPHVQQQQQQPMQHLLVMQRPQAMQQQQQQQRQLLHDTQAAVAQVPWDLIPSQQMPTRLQPPQDPYSSAVLSNSSSFSSSRSISQPGGAGSSSSSSSGTSSSAGSSSSSSSGNSTGSSSSSTLLPPIDPEAVEASVAAALDSLTEADLRFDAAELAAAWLPCCLEVAVSNKVFTKKQCEKLAAAGLNNMLQVGEEIQRPATCL